jgi:arylsulfatase
LSLFVEDDHLVFDYNCFGDHHVVTSDGPVPEGPSVVGVRFRRIGPGGEATLVLDDVPAGSLSVPFAMTIMSSVGPSVGYDHGSPVSERYAAPFPFEGVLDRLDITLLRQSRQADAAQAEAAERAAMTSQ